MTPTTDRVKDALREFIGRTKMQPTRVVLAMDVRRLLIAEQVAAQDMPYAIDADVVMGFEGRRVEFYSGPEVPAGMVVVT